MTDPQSCTTHRVPDASLTGPGATFPQRVAELALRWHGSRAAVASGQVLQQVRGAALELLPAADYASITTVTKRRRGRPTKLGSLSADDPVCEQIDALHHQYQQGPCFDAVAQSEPVVVNDVSMETRWPAVMAAIVEHTQVRSMMSIQLTAAGQTFGALNVFAAHSDAFDTQTRDNAVVLATHAAVAVSAATRLESLNRALESRDLIGQVKGMLMERWSIDDSQAFAILSELSQESNVALVQVCTQLINAARHTAPPAPLDE